jgi:hypothetical protein
MYCSNIGRNDPRIVRPFNTSCISRRLKWLAVSDFCCKRRNIYQVTERNMATSRCKNLQHPIIYSVTD